MRGYADSNDLLPIAVGFIAAVTLVVITLVTI
jgi:hypothetical protein